MHAAALACVKGAVAPSKNNLINCNKTRDAGFMEALYWQVMDFLCQTNGGFGSSKCRKGYLRRFKKAIHAVDSTTVQLADFLGNNANAVRWQIWAGLLVHLLLRFLAWQSSWGHAFSRIAAVVRAAVWQRWDVRDLLRSYGTASPPGGMTMGLKQAFFRGFT